VLAVAAALLLSGCSTSATSVGVKGTAKAEAGSAVAAAPQRLPDSAYYLKPGLPRWVDPESGYDTTRQWKLEGGEWPVMMVLSPSQAPQALYGFSAGEFEKRLKPFGITPKLERIDGPPRTFHALERSKWPFVYMPLAVFMDYVRSEKNQGGAGGLQYVALAGSTAGGGYTLLARDPSIKSVTDLKGKKVGFLNTNPAPGALLTKAAKNAGIAIGEGASDIHVTFGPAGDQMNRFGRGQLDAIVSLNIYKAALIKQGAHPVTDFADVGYRANYTILVVERTVLERRPDVVDAFLQAHYAAEAPAEKAWKDGSNVRALLQSWNGFFAGQNTKWSTQRPVANEAAYKAMLGRMEPELRLDKQLVEACFDFNGVHRTWGWRGTVDTAKLVEYGPFDQVLKEHGQAPQ
jgi:hypothetical protein